MTRQKPSSGKDRRKKIQETDHATNKPLKTQPEALPITPLLPETDDQPEIPDISWKVPDEFKPFFLSEPNYSLLKPLLCCCLWALSELESPTSGIPPFFKLRRVLFIFYSAHGGLEHGKFPDLLLETYPPLVYGSLLALHRILIKLEMPSLLLQQLAQEAASGNPIALKALENIVPPTKKRAEVYVALMNFINAIESEGKVNDKEYVIRKLSQKSDMDKLDIKSHVSKEAVSIQVDVMGKEDKEPTSFEKDIDSILESMKKNGAFLNNSKIARRSSNGLILITVLYKEFHRWETQFNVGEEKPPFPSPVLIPLLMSRCGLESDTAISKLVTDINRKAKEILQTKDKQPLIKLAYPRDTPKCGYYLTAKAFALTSSPSGEVSSTPKTSQRGLLSNYNL